jgi:predicted nucleotide-binding protein
VNQFEKLCLNVEALFHAVTVDKKFFASIYTFVEKLHSTVIQRPTEARKQEIEFFAQKIEDFFRDYRPSGDGPYLPPQQTSRNDETVKEIQRLAKELGSLSDEEFSALKPAKPAKGVPGAKGAATTAANCIFIGHGRSKLWARLNVFLKDELGLKTVFYESESRVGESIIPILEKMLSEANFAVLVLTAEDAAGDGAKRARQNVIHEAGLFQGRLGFDRAILLVQRGLEGFSNVDGLQYLPFSDENIEETFYQLQRALKAKGIHGT